MMMFVSDIFSHNLSTQAVSTSKHIQINDYDTLCLMDGNCDNSHKKMYKL